MPVSTFLPGEPSWSRLIIFRSLHSRLLSSSNQHSIMTGCFRQTGRFIYLLALFQLVAGPLVIGGVMLAGRFFQDGAVMVSRNGANQEGCQNESFRVYGALPMSPLLVDGSSSMPPGKSAPVEKNQDGKSKLWGICDAEDLMRACYRAPVIGQFSETADWLVTQSHPPPLPPPLCV